MLKFTKLRFVRAWNEVEHLPQQLQCPAEHGAQELLRQKLSLGRTGSSIAQHLQPTYSSALTAWAPNPVKAPGTAPALQQQQAPTKSQHSPALLQAIILSSSRAYVRKQLGRYSAWLRCSSRTHSWNDMLQGERGDRHHRTVLVTKQGLASCSLEGIVLAP